MFKLARPPKRKLKGDLVGLVDTNKAVCFIMFNLLLRKWLINLAKWVSCVGLLGHSFKNNLICKPKETRKNTQKTP